MHVLILRKIVQINVKTALITYILLIVNYFRGTCTYVNISHKNDDDLSLLTVTSLSETGLELLVA